MNLESQRDSLCFPRTESLPECRYQVSVLNDNAAKPWFTQQRLSVRQRASRIEFQPDGLGDRNATKDLGQKRVQPDFRECRER